MKVYYIINGIFVALFIKGLLAGFPLMAKIGGAWCAGQVIGEILVGDLE